MVDETDAGASYLAALKRSTAAAAPARAHNSVSPAETPPAIGLIPGRMEPAVEQRRSPRYQCQGSAQLRDTASGVGMWATFSDISLHGCYVEAAACYPLGAVLALSIEVNGFRLQATGEVRASYPGLGMGISFTNVSDADRERLRDLVRSISQPSVIMGSHAPERPSTAMPVPPAPVAANPAAVLETIQKFFEDRHVMGREEFLRILRKNRP